MLLNFSWIQSLPEDHAANLFLHTKPLFLPLDLILHPQLPPVFKITIMTQDTRAVRIVSNQGTTTPVSYFIDITKSSSCVPLPSSSSPPSFPDLTSPPHCTFPGAVPTSFNTSTERSDYSPPVSNWILSVSCWCLLVYHWLVNCTEILFKSEHSFSIFCWYKHFCFDPICNIRLICTHLKCFSIHGPCIKFLTNIYKCKVAHPTWILYAKCY